MHLFDSQIRYCAMYVEKRYVSQNLKRHWRVDYTMNEGFVKNRRLFFGVICVILIGLNVYSQIRCMEVDKDYERYEKLCNEYKQGNFTDDELENLQLELDAGVKIIKKALRVFIFKIIFGVIWIPAICFLPRKIYDFYKDNYLRYIIDFEDKISLVLIAFMVIIMFF